MLRIMDALEDHDDVQDVYTNFDIPDEILAGASSRRVRRAVPGAAAVRRRPGG